MERIVVDAITFTRGEMWDLGGPGACKAEDGATGLYGGLV